MTNNAIGLGYLLETTREVYNDMYTFPDIAERTTALTYLSRVLVQCKICRISRKVQVSALLKGGIYCGICNNKSCNHAQIRDYISYNPDYSSFFDYSEISASLIVHDENTRFPVVCRICHRRWRPTIKNHFICRKGCVKCGGYKRFEFDNITNYLSFERFMSIGAKHPHFFKFDYSAVLPEHFTNKEYSCIPVKCKRCQHSWTPNLYTHFVRKLECPQCVPQHI